MSGPLPPSGAGRFLAVIPVRKGASGPASGVLVDLGDRPVLAHSVAAAQEAPAVERVIVASADEDASRWCRPRGVECVALPPYMSRPSVTAETVLLHVLAGLASEGCSPDHIIVLAPQLPLRRPGRVATACDIMRSEGADSLMSVCREPPFLWRPSPAGLIPFYDPQDRPARASASSTWFRENGSIYVVSCRRLVETGLRLGGRLSVLEMEPAEAVRTDEDGGLEICRSLLAHVRPEWARAALACRDL